MNDDVVTEWVEELLKQCARWNIVFVQLGEAYPVARGAIAPRMDDVVPVRDYVDQLELTGSLRLVTNVEELLEPGAPTLGRLRERVIADRDKGVRVVLLSRRPKIAFPTVPGSQVLRDAKLVPPPRYGEGGFWNFGEEATKEGIPQEIIIEGALRELGEVACADLDAFIFEDGRESQGLVALGESLKEALLSAGLVVSSSEGLEWAVVDGNSRIPSALANVIAGMRRPQTDFARMAADCWIVERLVKQAIRARARALWGDQWRMELLGTSLGRVALERAVGGTYPGAETLDDLRDPLEWLSLAETLGLLSHPDVGSLGVNRSMWTLMQSELLPVKDRVERSQLMRRDDVDVAQRWAALLSQRLSLSGSKSSSESFSLATGTQRELLERLRDDLSNNPQLRGDVEKDLMSLVLATVKFLAHTLETRPPYTQSFKSKDQAPFELALQDAFKAALDMSDLAGRSAVEVSSIAGGRADVVLYFDDGTRYVTEVKRELIRASREDLEEAYLPQAVAYQSANVPFGQLLVLDLTSGRDASAERLDESIWVAHNRNEDGAVLSSTVIAVVRGNRLTPSRRKR